jgi:hypothetical protein
MADVDASRPVERHRGARRERAFRRFELQVPHWLSAPFREKAALWRRRHARLGAARRDLDLVLGTINAPRPRPIDAETLLACLLSDRPIPEWRPHLEALFDEVSEGAIRDLVLAGVIGFEDLYRATRTWGLGHARNAAWIREMADLSMARSAGVGDRPD